jgi:hypothetical protein
MLRMIDRTCLAAILLTGGLLSWTCSPVAAAVRVEGQVQAGGAAVANSTVTLWAASAGEPKQLAQTQTGSDGRFQLGTQETVGNDTVLYLVAKGGVATIHNATGKNTAIALFEVDPVSWTPICLSLGVHDVEEAPPLCAGIPSADVRTACPPCSRTAGLILNHP